MIKMNSSPDRLNLAQFAAEAWIFLVIAAFLLIRVLGSHSFLTLFSRLRAF